MKAPLNVLVVEDSEDDTLLLMRELRLAGYDPRHERVDRPETMRSALDRQSWDIVISDYSMPYFRGDAALALLRERDPDLPFLFLSGTIGEEAAVAAMKVGANDYIIKGHRTRLLPAIKRELREAESRRAKKQAEQALRESETRYRELFENATYGIYRSENERRFLDANPAVVNMLGYATKQEVLGLDLARDVYRGEEARNRVLQACRGGERFQGIEVEWKHKDGHAIVVRLSGYVRRASSNGPPEMEIIAEDVTQNRALEKQISVLQKLDAIGRLAGGIAHDFNNVIGVIVGWAEMGLASAPQELALRRPLERILDHGRLAGDLTRQLLAFARNQPLQPSNIDLNKTVSDVMVLLGRTIGAAIEIKTDLDVNLKGTVADPSQVQQVLMNLCLNARDAMPKGGKLLIETRNVKVDKTYTASNFDAVPGDYLCLRVSDTGTGMQPAVLERIFEPFFTTKESGKGTGLGLATVYGVVRQHQGFIQVFSEVGKGTTFRVYWPVRKLLEIIPPPALSADAIGGNETLLLADDHEGLRELFVTMLSRLGYTVLAATNGEEAVRLFRENASRVSLVILDVTMPKLTGPEAYKHIRAIQPEIPVIFSTGHGKELESIPDLPAHGATVIHKPYDRDTLARQVRASIDSSKA